MKTFHFTMALDGRITIPDAVLKDLRSMAAEEPADGGEQYLNKLHKEHYTNDDEFLRLALKHALRNVVRVGFVSDVQSFGTGVGLRLAPADVTVDVPDRVVTKVKGREQLEAVAIKPNPEYPVHGDEGALEQADA